MQKRIILLLICFTCLCGCSMKYELTIDEDLSFHEDLKLYETKSFIRNNIDNDLTSGINKVVSTYRGVEEALGIELVDVGEIEENDSESVYYNIYKTYADIDSYSSSFLISNYFKSSSHYQRKGEYTIFLSNLNYDKINTLSQKYQYKFSLDKMYFYITLPFEVKEHNADIVDGNSYIWIFSKDSSNRDIKLIFMNQKKIEEENKGNVIDNIISSTVETVSGGKVDGKTWLNKYKFVLYSSIIMISIVVCVIIIRRKIKKADKL